MNIIFKRPLSAVNAADIQSLVDDATPESHILDYKQEAPADSRSPDRNKQDFLVDVAAFANAGGGAIVYGVREQRDANGQPTGVPEATVGLRNLNVDVTIRQLRAMLDASIDPRIPAVEFHAVEGFQDGPVLIVRIERSWRGPHRVVMGDRSFPIRRERSNGYFNSDELRAAMSIGASVAERLRRFRDERVSRIFTNDAPIPLDPRPRLVLHVVPLEALAGARERTSAELRAMLSMVRATINPQSQQFEKRRWNLDGVLVFLGSEASSLRYVQLFRWGAVEHVDAYEIGKRETSGKLAGKLLLDIGDLRDELRWSLADSMKILERLGYAPPLSVMISVVGARGYQLTTNAQNIAVLGVETPIDRDVLLLPDRVVESYAEDPATIIEPGLDLIRDAAGG